MRIVHLAPSVGERSPGVRSPIQELGLGYRRAGHEFVILTAGRRSRREVTAFGTVITIPAAGLLRNVIGAGRSGRSIQTALTRLEPDHIEVSDPDRTHAAHEWALSHKVPAVIFGAARPTGAEDGSDRYLPSIGPGVDLELFSPLRWSSEVRHEYFGNDAAILVRAGGESKAGAIRDRIDALGELRSLGVDARLVIAGNGPWRTRIERETADLPITFLANELDRRELAELLATADVCVRLEPGDDRTLGELESLASGTPVVDGVASEIARVLSISVDERRQSAREHASEFAWSTTITSMLELHDALSASDPPTPFDEALS